MLSFENVAKTYATPHGEVQSLRAINLRVAEGEFVAIRGPSGCGKTTVLLTAGGMLRPTSGAVVVDGQDLYRMGLRARAKFRAQKIGFVFQMFHLIPYLNVLENVLLAAGAARNRNLEARASGLLAQLGLEERTWHTPPELSAGERQRTALARALLNRPRLILADEPTGNLDPDNEAEVFRHLSEFHRAGGTVVVVTHGSSVDAYAQRVIEMRSGSVQDTGASGAAPDNTVG